MTLAMLIDFTRRQQNITLDQIGDKFGATRQTVAKQLKRDGKQWRVGEILAYCDILDIPYQDALAVAAGLEAQQ